MCATPTYIAKHGKPNNIESLSVHEALVYWRNEQAFPWTLTDAHGAMVTPDLKWRLQFDNQEAIVDAAVRGFGIACLPGWLVRGHLEDARLVPLLEQFSLSWLDTYAVWPTAPYLPLRLSVVIDALAARLPAQTNEVRATPL